MQTTWLFFYSKKYSDVSVYDAAEKRFDFVYGNFDKIDVSFSGGTDTKMERLDK